ncbi:E4 ubiquitin-protein ligase UFD2 [Spathaspora sp. JA1]|nr:E4 ubiquitin-protein ligase UFD2 [Spathaspora sp. JA1]
MSTQDEIRAKRLARLQQLEAQHGQGRQQAQRGQQQQQQQQQEQQIAAAIEASASAATSGSATAAEDVSPAVEQMLPEQTLSASSTDPFTDWVLTQLEFIFQATVNPNKNNNQHDLVFLYNLAYELQQRSTLTPDDIESIFMEILTEIGIPAKSKSLMEYLYLTYHNTFRIKRTIPVKANLYQEKIQFLNQVIKFSINYAGISFHVVDLFINNDVGKSLDFFVARFHDVSSFLIDVINNQEDEELLELLNLIFPYLSFKISTTTTNQSSTFIYLLSIYESLVSIKSVAAIFSQINGFQPPSQDQCLDYEHKTLLGPLLRLSPLLDEMAVNYFQGVNELTPVQIKNTYTSIQNEYNVIITHLFTIVDKLVRGSGQTRTDLVEWFAKLINLNHLRRGSHADFKKLSSDGIMYNISIILIKLSLPFLTYPLFNKIDKIDVDYFKKNKLLDVIEESRVNSTIEEVKQEYAQVEEDTNFISDCFNLTLAYLHYGIGGIYIKYDRLKQQIKQAQSRVDQIESGQTPPGLNPMMISFLRQELPKLKKTVVSFKSVKHAIQAIFNHTNLQLEIFDFIIGATTFIIRLIDPSHSYPHSKLEIPIFKISKVSELDDHDYLKTKTPKPWKYYPEFIVEGIVNYCKFSTNFYGCPLVNNQDKLTCFCEFIIILLRCPELIGNPHLKSNLIEILFFGSSPMNQTTDGFMISVFNNNKLIIDNILYSLLDFYVMVEKTGASSQFYDKFNSRYYISVILEQLWKNPIYRYQLKNYSTNNVDFFIRFIARMLNDTTYLLDETFNVLNEIHDIQQELKTRQISPGDETRGTNEELASNLETLESRAKSYMGLSNKTMELFKLFTKEVPRGFMLAEIIDRLAGMLNYNLSIMVGPKCSNLKVETPEKYNFEPKTILTLLCEIYVNLSSQQEFINSVARDERSFNLAYFEKAEKILTTKTFVESKTINTLIKFAHQAEDQRKMDQLEEMEMGEIPDEFLDPLMFTLMNDPVILPGSKVTIDRATIKAHLLSDSTDPFNRMPLNLDDVVDNIELKQKIEEFRQNSKQK